MSTALLHSPADILRWVLIQIGQGTNPALNSAWPIYATSEPPSPDEVITVYDTSQQNDGRIMNDGEQCLHYGIQVRVRATDHKTGFQKANALRIALDEGIYENVVLIDSQHYLLCSVVKTNLLILGKEVPTSKRSLFTINGLVTIQPLY